MQERKQNSETIYNEEKIFSLTYGRYDLVAPKRFCDHFSTSNVKMGEY